VRTIPEAPDYSAALGRIEAALGRIEAALVGPTSDPERQLTDKGSMVTDCEHPITTMQEVAALVDELCGQGDELAAALNYEFQRCGFNETDEPWPHAVATLRKHDAAKDAEIVALAAGLRLSHKQMADAGLDMTQIEQSVGLDACKRAMVQHDESLVRPLVEALTRAIRALRFADGPEGAMCEYSSLADELDAALVPHRITRGASVEVSTE
jgi:hypothetical protein